MNNVTRLPFVNMTPRELITEHADKIDSAESIVIVIRDKEGVPHIYYTIQSYEALNYSTSALVHDVANTCFGVDR